MESSSGVGVVRSEPDEDGAAGGHDHGGAHVAEPAQARAGRSGAVEQLNVVVPANVWE